VCYSINEKVYVVADTLFKYDGLLKSTLQWSFWDYRSDIVKEISDEELLGVRDLGNAIIRVAVVASNYLRDETGAVTEKGKTLMDIIGTTPIVSKDYDPNCKVTFVEGYMRHLKKTKKVEEWDSSETTTILHIVDAGYIDKGVISEVIDLGLRYVSGHQSACFVAGISHDMIYREIKIETNESAENDLLSESQHRLGMLNDTRVAFAIRAGLVEMCLSFIGRFGVDDSLYDYIHRTLTGIYSISLHSKSAKAIRSKRHDIEEKLGTTIVSNNESKKLLEMVRCILDINGSYCCRCNRSLTKTEVLQCNGCGRMTYCSRACQKEDWLNGGHKIACCKSYTDEKSGQFQGRAWPSVIPNNERDTSKLKELETNLNMIQLKLFRDHSETILSQAKALGIPLCDCIVSFDLSECPMKIKTFAYTQSESKEEREGFEASRSKDNITCLIVSKTCIGDNVLDQDGDVVQSLQMQRLFPHEWLKKGGTSSAHGAKASEKEKTQPAFHTHWNKERRKLDPAYEYNIPKVKAKKKV